MFSKLLKTFDSRSGDSLKLSGLHQNLTPQERRLHQRLQAVLVSTFVLESWLARLFI